jgi:hypothetical protein
MPAPTKDSDSRDVHVVPLPRFSDKKAPAFTEVKQAPSIANCPVAAMLAALAFTSSGQKLIQGMVSETPANVVTDLSAAGTLSNPPSGARLSSGRYFTVKLQGDPIDVSDVLYTDDHDSGWSPFYMRDPGDHTIWAAIIEKALAVKLGSYENIDALNLTANDFWEKILGVKPGGLEIKPDSPLSDITDRVKASTNAPSIGASKGQPGSDMQLKDGTIISANHGFALLGLQGDKIRMYDPAKAKTLAISPADFRANFLAILYLR